MAGLGIVCAPLADLGTACSFGASLFAGSMLGLLSMTYSGASQFLWLT